MRSKKPKEDDSPDLTFIPVESATKYPPSGHLYHITDKYFIVHPKKGVVFSGSAQHPQCSQSEKAAFSLRDQLYPWAKVQFFPSVFLPIDPATK